MNGSWWVDLTRVEQQGEVGRGDDVTTHDPQCVLFPDPHSCLKTEPSLLRAPCWAGGPRLATQRYTVSPPLPVALVVSLLDKKCYKVRTQSGCSMF